MKRRDFIKYTGASCALLAATDSLAAKYDWSSIQPPVVGELDLNEINIVDTHVHPPHPITLSESYDKWNSSFVGSMLPSHEYEGKEQLRKRLSLVFKEHLYNMPRQTGYYNYVSRVYGVNPDLDGFNSVVTRGIKRGFSSYIESILDREKIEKVVLESREIEARRPESPIPPDRFVWSYNIARIIQPEWAAEKGISSLKEVVAEINNILEQCVADACVGFKVNVAYYRPLGINLIDAETAEKALQKLLKNPATLFVPFSNVADYKETEMQEAFRNYQDFLLRHIYIKVGELKSRVIIHTAVALHPALRFDFNSPLQLRDVFLDDEIKRVETRFLLIHTGYPYHQHVAAMLSQFPNVYTDLSFYSKFPGVLEETLRAFLALAPADKVMHGSDSNNVPEEIGYCAWNVRQVLAKILRDHKSDYGWSQSDCEVIANKVLHENAKRLFSIGS